MPKRTSMSGSELFIVDNSDQVCFGVEFILPIYSALDFTRADCTDYGGYALQKVVLLLFRFQARVEAACYSPKPLFERFLGSPGNFVTHQNADFVNL